METSDNISYIYDKNGNMVVDKNKGITLIEYKDFNLPTKIYFSTEDQSSKYIEYVYDAAGVKLRKLVKDENQSNYHISLYAGAYIYEQTTSASSPSLKFILQPEGYFEPTGTSPSGELEGAYTYQYKDHTSTMLSAGLGNIRLSYSDIDGNGVIDPATEIKEAKDYYAFGLEHNVPNKQIIGTKHPYGYNGKEENGELGLEWLDFGARNYDASLGRWMNVDPLAELMPDQSPYNYAFNNPVFWIDPDGRMPEEGDAGGGSEGGGSEGGGGGEVGFELGGGGDPPTEFTPEELKETEVLDNVLVVTPKNDDYEKTQNDKKKKSDNQTQKKQKKSKSNGKPSLWDRFVDWLRRKEPKLDGAGGGLGYGQGSGSGMHVRKNGTANMDPIDLSKGMPLGGPFRTNMYLRSSSTGRAVYINTVSFTHGVVDQTVKLVDVVSKNANNEITFKISLEPKQYIFTTYGYFDTGVNISKKDTIQIYNNKSFKEVSDSLNTKAKNRWGIETKSRYEKL